MEGVSDLYFSPEHPLERSQVSKRGKCGDLKNNDRRQGQQ